MSDKSSTQPQNILDYVHQCCGRRAVTKVLLCTNGLAAVKCMRSIRSWAYKTVGNERAVTFIALATENDLNANAEYIRLADMYVEVPGGASAFNYANVSLIVDMASRAGVDAVWAGWGHASEDPHLPEQLAALDPPVCFMGPQAAAMLVLGDKISSTIVAQSAGLPCIPWSGTGICGTLINEDGAISVPSDAYKRACVRDAEHGLSVAQAIGFPVMIKASGGGGGKGIRVCNTPTAFWQLFGAVTGEVPGSPIFIMKLAQNARHLEVQLLADQYGQVVSLFGRDCSVQRRHQKIIEEAPVCIAPPEVCQAMEDASVRLAKLVGYESVGTVEWLYIPASREYMFLELNPRLQVEHPTTEMISGVNVPAAQLQIAMGIPLHRIDDVCALYGVSPRSHMEAFSDAVQQTARHRAPPRGHVIACRITAEDPDTGFRPNIGALHELHLRTSPSTWGYFSVSSYGALHEYADSQLGHIFAHGSSREDARMNMVIALKELSVHGQFRTTVEYLVMLLETNTFVSNASTTDWVDTLLERRALLQRVPLDAAVLCGATVRAQQSSNACRNEFHTALSRGQVPSRSTLRIVFPITFVYEGFVFNIEAQHCGPNEWRICLNTHVSHVGVRELRDGGMLIRFSGRSHTVYWSGDNAQTRLSIDGHTCTLEAEHDPSRIRSPTPGKLVRYLVCESQYVEAGTSIAEVEIMKMYMPVLANVNGRVSLTRSVGDTLSAGDVLAHLQVDDATQIRHASPFAGTLSQSTHMPPTMPSTLPHHRLTTTLATLNNVLAGYFNNDMLTTAAVDVLIETLRDPMLPIAQLCEALALARKQLSPTTNDALAATLSTYTEPRGNEANMSDYFVLQVKHVLRDAVLKAKADSATLAAVLSPAFEVIEAHSRGTSYYESSVLCSLLRQYATVETSMVGGAAAVLKQRSAGWTGDEIFSRCLSHEGCARKNKLVLRLLDPYIQNAGFVSSTGMYKEMVQVLQSLSTIRGAVAAPVAHKAREILLGASTPTWGERRAQMERALSMCTLSRIDGSATMQTHGLEPLVALSATPHRIVDVLHSFFVHPSPSVAYAAFITYVLRAYRAYEVLSFQLVHADNGVCTCPVLRWEFRPLPDVRISPGKVRQASVTDLELCLKHAGHASPRRIGVMTCCERITELEGLVERVLSFFGTDVIDNVHVLAVAIRGTSHEQSILLSKVSSVIVRQSEALSRAGLCRVTLLLCRDGAYPLYLTWRREGTKWCEQQSIRNVEPALAHELELDRMVPHFIMEPVQLNSSSIHLYFARGKQNLSEVRFFVRILVHPIPPPHDVRAYVLAECERLLVESLDNLEVALGQREYSNADGTHLFFSWLHPVELSLIDALDIVRLLAERYSTRLNQLRVDEAETRIVLISGGSVPRPVRIFVSTETAFTLRYEAYDEVVQSSGNAVLKDANMHHSGCTFRDGQNIHAPYVNRTVLATRRARAQRLGTTFAYDLVDALRHALRARNRGTLNVEPILEATELVLESTSLVPSQRSPEENYVAMVAWYLRIATDEYPNGRPLFMAANDISVKAGSFGMAENSLLAAVTYRAQAEGVPLLYISANSGARLGLAPEILDKFQVRFQGDDPALGVDYLYLDDAALQQVVPGSVSTVPREAADGSTHHVIKDVIGNPRGDLGVECLSGSGRLAGEMSRAREKIFTATIVTGRSVGIGAYLARLSGRVIQVGIAPMILTGFQALNRLLGRDVYSGNLQLGGPQVMTFNGVTHLTTQTDLEAMHEYLRWLSYVPARAGDSVLILRPNDPIERRVAYVPPTTPYDPRCLISGTTQHGITLAGLFDSGSFQETLVGWATSVVVGRARLGGIPFGVVAAETRTLERVELADPANPNSSEERVHEAGQVWYPNSAMKTAQAIMDFDREGLPLMILANWRGFSGGQRDMHDAMLMQGSKIVDALAVYAQPVFVHLPPHAELRGGSWVVLDSAVSADGHIEMTADPSARGGVLEAEGLVEIKFREEQRRRMMSRLDSTYAALEEQARHVTSPANEINKLREREKKIGPFINSIAIQYADAQDRVGRMLATGVVRHALPWEGARTYFYWRARRRLAEIRIQQALRRADSSLDTEATLALLHRTAAYSDNDRDEAAVRRIETSAASIHAAIAAVRDRAICRAYNNLMSETRV